MLRQKHPGRVQDSILNMVYSALIAAMLFAAKTALRALPNIEILTALILVFGAVFRARIVFPAVVVFCTLEWLVWGFGYWVVYYYLYYPSLALAACLLKRVKNPVSKTVWAAALGVAGSAVFCLLSVAVDAAFYSGFGSEFLLFAEIVFFRGVTFYITLIVSNAIVVPVLFPVLTNALRRLTR